VYGYVYGIPATLVLLLGIEDKLISFNPL
jgi:hypothetical protein